MRSLVRTPQLNEELKAIEAKHQTTNGSVGELTDALSALTDELEELKEKMDAKGDTVRLDVPNVPEEIDTCRVFWLAG